MLLPPLAVSVQSVILLESTMFGVQLLCPSVIRVYVMSVRVICTFYTMRQCILFGVLLSTKLWLRLCKLYKVSAGEFNHYYEQGDHLHLFRYTFDNSRQLDIHGLFLYECDSKNGLSIVDAPNVGPDTIGLCCRTNLSSLLIPIQLQHLALPKKVDNCPGTSCSQKQDAQSG